MINKSTWKQAEEIVHSAVHEADPYGLLSGGAPEDEFDSEILAIVGAIKNAHSSAEVTSAISNTFGKSFEPESFTPAHCEAAGTKIFNALIEEQIIKAEPENGESTR